MQHPNIGFVAAQFHIRLATIVDAALIARHRVRMFQDMGMVPDQLFESFREQAELRLREALASGEYKGWLASPADRPGQIIAGAGVQLRQTFPNPILDSLEKVRITDGRQALIINVYTEADWRRRGLARLLMEKIMAWAREEKIDTLVLHASDEARSLYEKLGFIQTNEMRFRATY